MEAAVDGVVFPVGTVVFAMCSILTFWILSDWKGDGVDWEASVSPF